MRAAECRLYVFGTREGRNSMGDEFTEVMHQGWGGSIMESIKCELVGVVLFLASFQAQPASEGSKMALCPRNTEYRGGL